MTTICLVMICKDESAVIERCLRSALPLCDCALISDTGSTDDTLAIIDNFMEYRLAINEEPWHDFSWNRNQAIELAKAAWPTADYLLFLDADEMLSVPEDFQWPDLTADAYWLPVDYYGTQYKRLALVKSTVEMRYVGVVHEYLEIDPSIPIATLDAPTIVVHHDGARSRDPETYKKDFQLLLQWAKDHPDDARTAFYLAQSARDAGMPFKARDLYLHRAAMGGWDEERWMALYEAAKLTERDDPEQAVHYYLRAFQLRPQRSEPLYQLCRLYREKREWHVAWMFGIRALAIGRPSDRLFVDSSIYEWRIADELGIVGFYVGEMESGFRCANHAWCKAPPDQAERIQRNKEFYAHPLD